MKCKACNKPLGTTGDRRPLRPCRPHLICVACFTQSNSSCPLCKVTPIEPLEALIDHDTLECLKELRERPEVQTGAHTVYHCERHSTRQIEFYCAKDRELMCGKCAWSHVDHKNDVISYPHELFTSDVTAHLRLIENFRNECTEIQLQLENIIFGEPKSGPEIIQTLFQARRFATKHATGKLDVVFPTECLVPNADSAPQDDTVRPKQTTKVTAAAAPKLPAATKCAFPRPITCHSSINLTEAQRKSLHRMVGTNNSFYLVQGFRLSHDSLIRKFYNSCGNRAPIVGLISGGGAKFGFYTTGRWDAAPPGTRVLSPNCDFVFKLEPEVQQMMRGTIIIRKSCQRISATSS